MEFLILKYFKSTEYFQPYKNPIKSCFRYLVERRDGRGRIYEELGYSEMTSLRKGYVKENRLGSTDL